VFPAKAAQATPAGRRVNPTGMPVLINDSGQGP